MQQSQRDVERRESAREQGCVNESAAKRVKGRAFVCFCVCVGVRERERACQENRLLKPEKSTTADRWRNFLLGTKKGAHTYTHSHERKEEGPAL